MRKKLKSFPVGIISPTVIVDENGQYRVGRVQVNEKNDLCVRYYLPKNKRDRYCIKVSQFCSVPQIAVYE
jgi:hypothetical protein